ncbi:putative alpha-glucosidase/alpha-amylase [Peziza echinospora]|nr:putative alpha-glucosidase/alpha-amylase [Peziza echinospora]
MAFHSYIMDFDRTWWRESIIYEVYCQSFQDTNGDGIGDIPGITKRLGYLKRLGVDMLWLTPVYKSPMHDQGYDISDYRSINPRFGDMKDFDTLLRRVHELEMKLMMDLVVNHTSDEHEWFQESRKSKTSPKRNWYFWRPPKHNKDGTHGPPNNWESCFGGSAWTYDKDTKEYYLHLFDTHQPDLNWDTKEVREAVYDMLTWWAEKGVDGFRMDVINLISKVPGLPDAEISKPNQFPQPAGKYFVNGPNVHKYLREMNDRVLSRYDVCTVGEMPCGVNTHQASKYVAKERRELSMVFHFDHTDLDATNNNKWVNRNWKLPELKNVIGMWQQHMLGNHGWNSLYVENHDQPRATSRYVRFGDVKPTRELRDLGAKMVATMLGTMRGTVYIYEGQELGMAHPEDYKLEDYDDVETLNYYKHIYEERKKKGDKDPDMSDVMAALKLKSRDNARTPMQWDSSPHAGFTTANVKPWLRVNPDYKTLNAESQVDDPESVFTYYKQVLCLRKQHPALFYGGYICIDEENESIYAYLRTQGPFQTFVLLNFTAKAYEWTMPEDMTIEGAVFVLGNYGKEIGEELKQGRPHVLKRKTLMKPFEARIYTLRPTR